MKHDIDRTYEWTEEVAAYKGASTQALGRRTVEARVFRLARGRLWLETLRSTGFDPLRFGEIITRTADELTASGAAEVKEAR